MAAATRWRHTHPGSRCPDAERLLRTGETGRCRSVVACKKCRETLRKVEDDRLDFSEASLTDLDRACGVTPDTLRAIAPRVLVRDDRVVFPRNTAPAAASVILRALDGTYAFSHLSGGMPIYMRS